ncbi:MAG: T9SS type A sorting domain-containing protein [Crocinitomicaceae bacterium]|nr:T9SS type A sorting domain-containing protein [Crocinitomicaceae bacterium]MCF8444897.1 T9SS type A sorting domain-containing protein [Crocinitomicaceae bacterium]
MKKLVFLSLFALGALTTFSQQIVRSTIGSIGSSMGNGTLTVQQTAGQPGATTFVKKEDGSAIRQGFHQPYFYEIERDDLNVTIYPNPNNGQFSFQVAVDENVTFDYQLIDQQGKSVLENSSCGSALIEVKMEQSSTGMYYLKIVSGDKISTFKINVIQ